LSEKADLLNQPKLAIEEFLKADAKVYYEYLFSTKHIGRTLDLVLFESEKFIRASKGAADTEYKVRQLLEICIFNAWANYRKGEKVKAITVECGWDSERIGVLVSSLVDADVENFIPGIDAAGNETSARVSAMLEKVQKSCDGVTVRHSKSTGAFQVLAFINASSTEKSELVPVTYVNLEEIYVRAEVKPLAPTAGVEPVPLSAAKIVEFEQSEKDNHKKSLELRNRREGKELEEGTPEFKISGVTEVKEEGEVWLKKMASQTDEKKSNEDIIIGQTEKGSNLGSVTVADLKKNASGNLSGNEAKDIEEILQVLLNAIRPELVDLLPNLNEDEFQTVFQHLSGIIRENFIQAAHHLSRVRNIQMIAKVKQYKDQIAMLQDRLSQSQTEKGAEAIVVKGGGEKGSENEDLVLKPVANNSGSGPVLENNPAASVESRFNDLVGRFKKAIDTGEIPPAARAWAHGMMEEVLKDKASISQKIRDFDTYVKKREFDYRTKETTFKEQLRIKEEEIKQKNFSLDKTKEALQTALSNLERTKKIIASTESEAELKHKISVNEKLLGLSKENGERLSKRVDELQKKWQEEFNARAMLQQELSATKKVSSDLEHKLTDASAGKVDAKEIALVSTQRDRAQKMVDELKKQIKELQEKVAQSSAKAVVAAPGVKKVVAPGDAETKHRLDQSTKLVKVMKDELDRTKRRFEDLKLEETKLRVELAKTQAMLKVANKNTIKK
jgi:hypothetical protein